VESKEQKASKSANDYNWEALVHDGQLGKLLIPELNKYLVKHGLCLKGKKGDKVRRIIANVSKSFENHAHDEIELTPESEDEEAREMVLQTIDMHLEYSSGETEESVIDDDNDDIPVVSVARTRSGRQIKGKHSADYIFY
jgi:hypothetical protein